MAPGSPREAGPVWLCEGASRTRTGLALRGDPVKSLGSPREAGPVWLCEGGELKIGATLGNGSHRVAWIFNRVPSRSRAGLALRASPVNALGSPREEFHTYSCEAGVGNPASNLAACAMSMLTEECSNLRYVLTPDITHTEIQQFCVAVLEVSHVLQCKRRRASPT